MTGGETEASYAAPKASLVRAEPFRLFFPLGVLLGWVGVGHWLLYAFGVSESYSCFRHGLLQTQTFLMAFALGFLWTALPRRLGSPAATGLEISLAVAMLVATTAMLVLDRFVLAELGYLALFALMLQFALRRFLGGAARRRPPAAFVLLALGAANGIAGAALILARLRGDAPVWATGLGALFIEQGVFLCFVIGVGALVLPLMGGAPPPPDLGSSPRETWKAIGFLALGLVVTSSLVAEQFGSSRAAPIARGVAVAVGLGWGGGAWRPPAKPGFHRRLVWLSAWLAPIGLVAAGLLPDYRVPALHVLFIGGFSLMALAVATHVSLSHVGSGEAALGSPRWVVAMGAGVVLAMLARVAADWSDTYFDHLGWAAGTWIAGTAIWLAFVAPRLTRR